MWINITMRLQEVMTNWSKVELHIYIPGPSNGWCLNPKGLRGCLMAPFPNHLAPLGGCWYEDIDMNLQDAILFVFLMYHTYLVHLYLYYRLLYMGISI